MREEWFGREVAGRMELSPVAWRESIAVLQAEVQSLLATGGLVIVDTDLVNKATVLSLLSGLSHALQQSGVRTVLKQSLLGRPELLTGSEQVTIVPFPGSIYGLLGTGLPAGKVVVIPASAIAYERLSLSEPVAIPRIGENSSSVKLQRNQEQLRNLLADAPASTQKAFWAVAVLDAVAAPPTYSLLAKACAVSEDELEDIIVAADGLLHLSESYDAAPLFVTIPYCDEAQALLPKMPLDKRQHVYNKILRNIDWHNSTERLIALHLTAGLLEKGERRLGIGILQELHHQQKWRLAEPAQLVSWSRTFSSYRLFQISMSILDYGLKTFPASHELWQTKLTISAQWATVLPEKASLVQDVYNKVAQLWPEDDMAKIIKAKLDMVTGHMDKAKEILRKVKNHVLPSGNSTILNTKNQISRKGLRFPEKFLDESLLVGVVNFMVDDKKCKMSEKISPIPIKKDKNDKLDFATLTTWRMQAEIAKSTGDTKNAVHWYTKLAEHGQRKIESAVSLAEISRQEGNLRQAIAYTRQVLASDSENPDALWIRIQALVTLGTNRNRKHYWQQAAQDLQLLVEVDPERQEAQTLYRQLEEQLKNN